jgi:hypothetical protein
MKGTVNMLMFVMRMLLMMVVMVTGTMHIRADMHSLELHLMIRIQFLRK